MIDPTMVAFFFGMLAGIGLGIVNGYSLGWLNAKDRYSK